MAGTSARIRVDDKGLKALFENLSAAADDLTPAMERIGAAIVADVQQRFEEGVGPNRSPWPQSLRARLQGGSTLVDTKRLANSITYAAGPRSVQVGTNVIYAAIHQFGGTIKAKNPSGRLAFKLADGGFARPTEVTMPARPFLGIDDEEEGIIAREIETWLAGVAGPRATSKA